MATSSTRLRSRPGARGRAIGVVIDRLLAVKRGQVVPRSVERAATASRMPPLAQIRTLERDLQVVRLEIGRVQAIRERLGEVPARRQRGSVL